MSKAKTIGDYERERNLILRGDADTSKQVTADEFDELQQEHAFTGIDHAGRMAWLQDNGYEVNRANMMDISLPSNRPKRS